MTKDEILTQARQAIEQERTRRKYSVIVGKPMRIYHIAEVSIPPTLQAYIADTRCTVQHDHGIPCRWADFVIVHQGKVHVILESDLLRPGMFINDSIRAILTEIQREDTQR